MHLRAAAPPARNTKLRGLVVGRGLVTTAEWMWYTVTTVYAFTLSGVGAVGAISVAAVLPPALLSPTLGYVIDRFPHERILTGVFATRLAAVVITAVSAAFFPAVSILVAVIAVEGTTTCSCDRPPRRCCRPSRSDPTTWFVPTRRWAPPTNWASWSGRSRVG
ncbi:hypothetical protein [Mycobacterium genavense]|uniref:hypothetical protein n=1 Tax=Mycobacterium genavense TaxID=36812 RepID=UPI0004B113DE|nr:hypothetical protein [Mycobacterium genavense]